MVSSASIAACVFTLLISLVLPVALLIILALKNKKQGIVSAWLLGAAAFFISQMLIRLPLLTFLQSREWFMDFAQNRLLLYAFSLALTAALFEAAGRLASAGLMAKNLTWKRSLAAGLGHGGIEAMLLIGMTYVNNLVYIFMINSGSFELMLSQNAALGMDVTELELIKSQFLSMSPAIFLLAGFERLLAMICHTAMTVLVCFGVAHKKTGLFLLLCIVLHTLLDMTAGISLLLPRNMAYPIIYAILTVLALLSVFILKKLRKSWQQPVAEPEL